MKEKLLDAAESLVQSRGLNAVTFQHIADAVGLCKPSVFHHIRNKEELADALIARCSTKYGPQYVEIAERDVSAAEKLRLMAKVFERGLKEARPCLLAALSGAADSLTSDARASLKKAAEAATRRIAVVFAQGREDGSLEFAGTPESAALAWLGMMQGLQALCRVKGDPRAFRKAAAAYMDSIVVQS